MSWQIFVHSVRQVFGNLGGALQVSAVLTIIQAAISLFLLNSMMVDQETMQKMMQEGTLPVGKILIGALAQIFLMLWIVVGWHRYVLLNERANLVPVLRVDRMLGYLGKSILIGMMLIPVVLGLALVAGVFAMPLARGGMAGNLLPMILLALIVYLPATTIGARLSAVLPGVALKAGVPLMTGWEATRGETVTIGGVVLISLVCTLAMQGVGMLLFPNPLSIPSIVYSVVVQWIVAMVGASVLTTLYGHYVERRPLV